MLYGSEKDHVVVKKIDNGYVIEMCCSDEKKSEYIKSLSKAPAILKRWFGSDDKRSLKKIEQMEREESEEKGEGGQVKIKIKMTDK